jgi:regulatory protein
MTPPLRVPSCDPRSSRRGSHDVAFGRSSRSEATRDVADAAIVEVLHDEEVDEAAIIERVAQKKLRTLRGLDEETQRRRLFSYLARRGYDVEDVRVAVRSALGSS